MSSMAKLDATLDDVQNTRFFNLYHDDIRAMLKCTQFNETEISCILMVYHKFVLANGPKAKFITKKQFINMFLIIFRIYDLSIIERILFLITTDGENSVSPTAWVKLFSVFMSEDLEERMRFAFQTYCPVGGLSTLNREIVTLCVEKFFIIDDEDEMNELRSDMVDTLFRKFDIDKDGLISYEDYSQVVTEQPLLLEFLGQVFPETTTLNVISLCANILSKLEMASGEISDGNC